MKNVQVRVRFAPSPTGLMHLGNVRAALMNYLFALQKNGTFILRIEDTDPERNFDPGAKHIIADLKWLGLSYNEGPEIGGPFAPYFQSERMKIYHKTLQKLIDQKTVYRCFCTTEELDKKRKRQIAMRMAPRYDKTCLNLMPEEIQKKVDAGTPFIWRMKLNPDQTVQIQDIAHGTMKFELKNFSDFPLTRQNGTYTFMFANFVDDMTMEMSHILRGEDHVTNTAGQAALYEALGAPVPTFWHLPILCDINGKKLSKRDFGFSLQDLKNAGYLPEAICNYLAIIGGSFEKEIMSLEELAKTMNFDHTNAKGQIKFDAQKLDWVNHKWIAKYNSEKLAQLCLPYLASEYPQAEKLNKETLTTLIDTIKTDLTTLKGVISVLRFYFKAPKITETEITSLIDEEPIKKIINLISEHINSISDPEKFLKVLKEKAKKENIPLKALYSFLRMALMGTTHGPGIKELITMLGHEDAQRRLELLIKVAQKNP